MRQIFYIFRLFSVPSSLAAFLLIAERPQSLRSLTRELGLASPDAARKQMEALRGAGLITTWKDNGQLHAATSDNVDVDPEAVHINAGGYPITIGRYIKETGQ